MLGAQPLVEFCLYAEVMTHRNMQYQLYCDFLIFKKMINIILFGLVLFKLFLVYNF